MLQRRFLIVTDDLERAEELESLLAPTGAATTRLGAVKDVLAEVGQRAHAAVLLDADSGNVPAFELCGRLRKILPPNSCALILFGACRAAGLVRGLDEGADDFWARPFNEPVCLAYLRAILRRITQLGTGAEVLKLGELLIDPVRRVVTIREDAVALRAKEFDLLYLLVNERGKALSREFLMESAWGREYFGTTRTIDFHVGQLRRKLGRWGRCIETVAGTGYRVSP